LIILISFLVTNGITSQSKVKVKHLKPNQVHKMVACEKPLASFPKSVNNSIKTNKITKSNIEKICLKEELLDDLDEMNEDHLSLLKDIELLQTIAMTENDIENKINSNHIKEDQEIDIYKKIKLTKSKDKS